MRTSLLLSPLLALGFLVVAGGAASAQTTPPPACPLEVPGAKVQVADTPGGVALTFTAPEANVGELRRRVQGLTDLADPCWRGGAPGRGTGGAGMAGATVIERVASPQVRVEDVPAGARLMLEAADLARLDTLRAHARLRAEKMRLAPQMMMMTDCPMMESGECPMMEQPSRPMNPPERR